MQKRISARDVVMTAIDFETTGSVCDWPVEAWQIGMVEFAAGRVRREKAYDQLLHIGDRPFNPFAPGRYALVRRELSEAPTLSDLWSELKTWWLERPLIGPQCRDGKEIRAANRRPASNRPLGRHAGAGPCGLARSAFLRPERLAGSAGHSFDCECRLRRTRGS